MGQQLYTNNAASTLAAGAASGATALTLTAGASFASPTGGDWQLATLVNETGTVIEIVKITARSGDVLTVVRAQEGTAAATWLAGDKVEARLTAGMLARLPINLNTNAGLALGGFTESTTSGGISLGSGADANATDSIAIGDGSVADGAKSIAFGDDARADMTGSIAIGADNPLANREFQLVYHAIAAIPRDDGWTGSGVQYTCGQETTWAGQFVELGVPQTWTASTTYTEGAVVQPSTPTGAQYFMYHNAFDPLSALNTVTTDTTEPTWPGSGGVAGTGTAPHFWARSDVGTGVDEIIPAGMVFYPTEVGFICFTHSGVTDAPFVSIGTVADPTLLVNNQQLSNITAASMRHAFTGLKHGITDLRFKLNTAATGASARFHGRFYAKGIFIQTQG